MRIPSLSVDYPIEQLGLVAGRNQLDTPHNATGAIGWYSIYDSPGQGTNSVYSAHVNYNGSNGPFAYLSSLGAGAEIVTLMADGSEHRYTVFANRRYVIADQYSNGVYPVIFMPEVLWPSNRPAGEEWVTLITCSCEPGRILDPDGDGFGDCVDRDVVIAKRTY
jgi:sortase (surface protein transpeptidase)